MIPMNNLDIEEPVRISRNLSLTEQIYHEDMYDMFVQEGLYEKTIDPDTREPVYIPLDEFRFYQQS